MFNGSKITVRTKLKYSTKGRFITPAVELVKNIVAILLYKLCENKFEDKWEK